MAVSLRDHEAIARNWIGAALVVDSPQRWQGVEMSIDLPFRTFPRFRSNTVKQTNLMKPGVLIFAR